MEKIDLGIWERAVQAIEKISTSNEPVAVTLSEAHGVARFVEKYYEPDPMTGRPGLCSVAKLVDTRKLAAELDQLVPLCRQVHSNILLVDISEDKFKEKVLRAEELREEISETLEYLLDDDIEEPADEALARARQREAVADTRARLIQALFDYATIATELQERLALIENFDLKMIDEAFTLGEELSEEGSAKRGRPASEDVNLRNRLLTLIKERVDEIRRNARFVFRKHPHIVRQATSAYRRRKRLAARRRKLQPPPPKDA